MDKKYSRFLIKKIVIYLCAFFLPVVFLIPITQIFPDYLRPISTIFFVSSVVISSWYFGLKPGIVTTVCAAIISTLFFIPPYSFYAFLTIPGILKITSFTCVGIIISYAIDKRTEKTKVIEYKQINANLKKRILELELEAESAKKEIKARDEFLSIASHELKTPLTSMLLQTQHAIHNIKNVSLANFSIDSLLRILENAENQTKRLSRMINDLLNISLITTGNMQLEFEQVDLNTLVSSVLNEFSPKITKDGYSIKVIDKNHIVSSWDKIRVEQAFSNLISNALKYGNHEPITITINKHRNFAQIEVADHGIGIPHEKQKSIFGLFERGSNVDKDNKEHKGLGVGLYITRQIALAHEGSVLVSSTEGKGSTFTLQLPIHSHKALKEEKNKTNS